MRVRAKWILGLMCLAVTAGAPQAAELADGSKELSLSASWTDTDGLGSSIFADVLLGFMLTPNHEVGPVLTYQSFDPDEDEEVLDDLLDNDQGVGGGFYRYNFSGGESFIPYIGGSVGVPFGDLGDFVDYTAGAEVGVRVMPSNNASINFEAFYNRQFASDEFDDFDQWGLAAGVSIFFGN